MGRFEFLVHFPSFLEGEIDLLRLGPLRGVLLDDLIDFAVEPILHQRNVFRSDFVSGAAGEVGQLADFLDGVGHPHVCKPQKTATVGLVLWRRLPATPHNLRRLGLGPSTSLHIYLLLGSFREDDDTILYVFTQKKLRNFISYLGLDDMPHPMSKMGLDDLSQFVSDRNRATVAHIM